MLGVKVLQNASSGPRSVALLELELAPGGRKLWIIVLDLPPDARGRPGHWCRTEHDVGPALALYDQAMKEHVAPAAE